MECFVATAIQPGQELIHSGHPTLPKLSIQACQGRVTLLQVASHFALLRFILLLRIREGVHHEAVTEVWRARLLLRPGHGHIKEGCWHDAGRIGHLPGRLASCRTGVGRWYQLSQSGTPQAVHRTMCQAPCLSCWTRGGRDSHLLASCPPESAAGRSLAPEAGRYPCIRPAFP